MEIKNSKQLYIPIYIVVVTVVTIIATFVALKFFVKYSEQNFTLKVKNNAEMFASQATSFISDTKDKQNILFLDNFAKSIIHNDKSVISVEFTDINNHSEVKISEKNKFEFRNIKISTPLVIESNGIFKTVGFLKMTVTTKYLWEEINQQKVFIISILFVLWIVFLLMFVISRILISRELNLLYCGLKHIADGHFGTKIKIDGRKETRDLVNIFNELSLQLKTYEEKNVGSILLERNKFEAILMSIVNGVVVCNNNDEIVLMNLSAEKMLAVLSDNVKGMQIQCYSDSRGEHCFREKIEEFKDTPLDLILKNPPEFNINVNNQVIKCTISPMFMQNDDYVGYIIVMLDVTKETEVNNMKNQFISNVSHELRTPVTVLRTYIDTLYTMADELDEDTRKEFTETANREVTRLHRMVNDILDVSRLESPNVVLEKEFADIIPVIKDTISSMQVLANEKNVKIEFLSDEKELFLHINVVNMERVFNNLISNAIKYSPNDDKIEVSLVKNSDFVDISVSDHGCGIPEECQAKLFERFYRVENTVHTVKGTGLGLYLVKTTVEKHHNGKVYVRSKVGNGSTFGIKLPLS